MVGCIRCATLYQRECQWQDRDCWRLMPNPQSNGTPTDARRTAVCSSTVLGADDWRLCATVIAFLHPPTRVVCSCGTASGLYAVDEIDKAVPYYSTVRICDTDILYGFTALSK